MINLYRFAAIVVLAFALHTPAEAVVLDSENKVDLTLSDGTSVVLYGRAGSRGRKTREYYYLPFNLRLSQTPKGDPEFLFTEYITEERADDGGMSGALMHFLVTWGPTPGQLEEMEELLKKKQKRSVLKGAIPLEVDSDPGSFRIISATLSEGSLASSQVTSGKAPALPGGRAAAASRLGPEGAQLMKSTFEGDTAITDLSLVFDYTYLLKEPAARGYIEIDWSRLEREGETLEAEYSKKQTGTKTKKVKILGVTVYKSSKPEYSRSYEETRSEYEFLREKNVIKVHFDDLRSSEATQKMQDAFFQFFLNAATEAAEPDDAAPPPPSDQEKEQAPNIRYGKSYKYKKSFLRNVNQRKTQKLFLSADVAVRYPIQLVGNLASWYDGVAGNDCCIKRVFLNDPFFDHRDINFILDLDAKDIFDEVINYVTVNVRKKRAAGRDFADRITIDQKYLEENGVNASLTYARGDDTSGDLYEYQAQWGLRGGKTWPEGDSWQKGSWEAVSLAPPVEPRTVEVEADLDELEDGEFTRATVQIHYPQFGEELEANIHVSPNVGENLIEHKIFTDVGAAGYVYRIILNHKRDGKLILPWQAKASDNYVYVNIPPEYFEEDSPARAEAKSLADEIIDTAKEKALDKFEELMK